MSDRLLTARELAEYLGLSPSLRPYGLVAGTQESARGRLENLLRAELTKVVHVSLVVSLKVLVELERPSAEPLLPQFVRELFVTVHRLLPLHRNRVKWPCG